VGSGVGAAGGTLAGVAAGAGIGSVVPGIGTVVGGVVGGLVGGLGGGLVGKGVAEAVNPTVEDAYWRENYKTRSYYEHGRSYEDYRPAYEYGWESRGRYPGQTFNEAEPELRKGWQERSATVVGPAGAAGAGSPVVSGASAGSNSVMDWGRARDATRDAWGRLDSSARGDADPEVPHADVDVAGACSTGDRPTGQSSRPSTPPPLPVKAYHDEETGGCCGGSCDTNAVSVFGASSASDASVGSNASDAAAGTSDPTNLMSATAGTFGAAGGTDSGRTSGTSGAGSGGTSGGMEAQGVHADDFDAAYWQKSHAGRSYAAPGSIYEEYEPAYRYGWESHDRHKGRRWDDVESDLRSGWEKAEGAKDNTRLGWDKARDAARDAWEGAERKVSPAADSRDRERSVNP